MLGWCHVKKSELVWRELVDAAITGQQRRWANVDDLAFRAGVAPATAFYALRRLTEIGAISQHHAGFTVVNPGKVLTLLCAARSVVGDALMVATLTRKDFDDLTFARKDGLIGGGASAAVELLGGVNTVSDYSESILYFRDDTVVTPLSDMVKRVRVEPDAIDGGDQRRVTFLLADRRAARVWRSHTSFAQTYADLFVTPGWQSSEFINALSDRYLTNRETERVSV